MLKVKDYTKQTKMHLRVLLKQFISFIGLFSTLCSSCMSVIYPGKLATSLQYLERKDVQSCKSASV